METQRPIYDWVEDAACKGQPRDWWFPEHPPTKKSVLEMRSAIAICNKCPVKENCLEHSLHWEHFGIWGGLTERRRMALRRLRGIKVRSPYYTALGSSGRK